MKSIFVKNPAPINKGLQVRIGEGSSITYDGPPGAVTVEDKQAYLCLSPKVDIRDVETTATSEPVIFDGLFVVEVDGQIIPHYFTPEQLPRYFDLQNTHNANVAFIAKPPPPPVITATYDSFYQTMTVNTNPNLAVVTTTMEGDVIGSGTTGEDGSVTYSIDEGMLRGGTTILTAAPESNVVSHSLVASFFVGSDVDGHNVGFNILRDMDHNWLSDYPEFSSVMSANLQGEMILEYSNGTTFTVDLSNYQGSRWGFNINERGIDNYDETATSKVGMGTAKIRFRNLNDKIFISCMQATHVYKFFDDGVSDVGYNLLCRDGRANVKLKIVPDYLPPAMTNLNSMFWSDAVGEDAFDTPEVASPIPNWDVSNIITMCSTFSYGNFGNINVTNWTPTKLRFAMEVFAYSDFNRDINWVTPELYDVTYMFGDMYEFNSNINLTMDNVVVASSFLTGCNLFNQPIEHLNTGKVENFNGFLTGCSSFNQPTNLLDVSSGKTFVGFYSGCTVFNQPMPDWKLTNLMNRPQDLGLYNFLYNAKAFSQDLSMFCVSAHLTEPVGFNQGGIMTPEQKPVWGTCPVPLEPLTADYDPFYQKITAVTTANTLVQTLDADDNVLGSGTTDESGNVEYRIDEGSLLYGAKIRTKSATSHTAEHDLQVSLVVVQDNGTPAYFQALKDYAWDNWSTTNIYHTAESTGQMYVEWEDLVTGQREERVVELNTLLNNSAAYVEPTWDNWFDVNPVRSRIRFRGLSTPMYVKVDEANRIQKFFDDGVSTGMGIWCGGWRARIDELPAYLPKTMTNLNSLLNGTAIRTASAVDVMANWDVSEVTSMSWMLANSELLVFPVSSWRPLKVVDTRSMAKRSKWNGSGLGSLSDWRTPLLQYAEDMFYSTDYVGDLSNWCVPLILTKPVDFDMGQMVQPVWGTCPSGY